MYEDELFYKMSKEGLLESNFRRAFSLYDMVFEGDGNLLPKDNGASFARKIDQAREYW
ncbi:DUF2441 domain-containing protein [Lysinibacillus odysseyi]|uniref:DUF2441 domain-containing protein n=1 Tax=Lysinibacillus odysseyi TaxID=202611 RepID=UPI000B093271